MQRPLEGQRWISAAEPGLGLGMVLWSDDRRVEIHYPAREEKRTYALETAPLVRVAFVVGDEVTGVDGRSFMVEEVRVDAGLLEYLGGGIALKEIDLHAAQDFIRPEKRLLAGLVDPPEDFARRIRAMDWDHQLRRSPARGFIGARIDLIPHQLAIALEATSRRHPRLLLADEVGLGKTIEACLILHHLHLTGRAKRILILVPEPLIHQWFIELLRRFNMVFSIHDEARCQAIEAHDADCNPFLDSQWILCATGFLTNNPERSNQAAAAAFDLLIVDEAHHLEWSPGQVSADYAMVEALAKTVPSLLLLTATPRQLGPEGHFARLRLLDQERYPDCDTFLQETHAFRSLATAVECLKAGELPENLLALATGSPRIADLAEALRDGDESARPRMIAELIDLFGTGRVFFRNTRDRLTGFPRRHPHLYPLTDGLSPYVWLANLLRSLPDNEKVLLITGSPEAAIVVREKLLAEIHVESALFHEELSLLQRDRHAAWFADPGGARILICSEIGSEGRNFQFARHLVLFGLPRDPDLIEQRIGRLDRIGQSGDIHIHVPHGVDDRSGMHARWLHEGLDAFSRPLNGAGTLADALLPELEELQDADFNSKKFDAFLERSRDLKQAVAHELASGHDRLLELGAPPPDKAAELSTAIRAADHDGRFEKFALDLFDHLGLDLSDLAERSYHLHRGQRHSETFAGLPEDGLPVTFSRNTALAREDLIFLTKDHPLLLGALESLLASESGNASFAHWKTGEGRTLFLDCVFLLETHAPSRLHLDRFLPPTVIRVTVDHHGREVVNSPPPPELAAADPRPICGQETFRSVIFPRMLAGARAIASEAATQPREDAIRMANDTLVAEIRRMDDLAVRFPRKTSSPNEEYRSLLDESLLALENAQLRLDALRLVWRT